MCPSPSKRFQREASGFFDVDFVSSSFFFVVGVETTVTCFMAGCVQEATFGMDSVVVLSVDAVVDELEFVLVDELGVLELVLDAVVEALGLVVADA